MSTYNKIREFINTLLMIIISGLIYFNSSYVFFKAFGIEIFLISIISFFYSTEKFYDYINNPLKYDIQPYYEMDCEIEDYLVIFNTLLYGVFSLFNNFIILLLTFGDTKLITYIIINFIIIGLFNLWIKINR